MLWYLAVAAKATCVLVWISAFPLFVTAIITDRDVFAELGVLNMVAGMGMALITWLFTEDVQRPLPRELRAEQKRIEFEAKIRKMEREAGLL